MNGGKVKGSEIISEGGYGCVHRPSLSCDGNDTKNANYITKLQKHDFNSKNEINIGDLIRKYLSSKSINESFATIISSCQINIKKIQPKTISECSIINKAGNKSDFILHKMRYVGKDTLDDYILNKDNMAVFIHTLRHLLVGLKKVIDMKIVHFDIKGDNILFDTKQSLPIIIDFGLSIPMNDITVDNLKEYLYVYEPKYHIWPLEVHYLNLLLHVTLEPDDGKLKELVNGVVGSKVMRPFTDSFKKRYANKCYQILKQYNILPIADRVALLGTFWDTWDNYALSVLYLNLLFSINKPSDNKHPSNKFFRFITELLVHNIDRKSVV